MYIGLSRYLFNDNCDDCIEEVSVQALTSVDTAVDLFVEPYDTHDWERIELDSTWLEHGGLLQQVSLVYSGQVLNLQLSQNGESITDDVVRLIVSPRNFEPQESGTQTWPNPPSPCLRLVADTRLVVSPKPKPSGKLDLILRMSLQDLDDDPSLVQLANQLNIDLVSVEQGTATIHPTVLAKLLIGNELTCCKKMMLATVMSGDNNRAIVKVVTSESLPDDSISTYLQLVA